MANKLRELILTSSSDSPITAYDPLTTTTLTHFLGSRTPRRGMTLVGKTQIASSHISPNTASSGFINLYNWWSSAPVHCIHVSEPIAPIVSMPDGSYLYSGGLSGHVHIFSLPSGNLYRSFQAHRGLVSCLAITDDGSLLISGGEDGTIVVFPILRLLDVSSDEHVLYKFHAHDLVVTCIAMGGGGCNSVVVSSSLDGTCKCWSIMDGSHLRTVRFPCPMCAVTVDPTNSMAYGGGSDGQVYEIPMKYRGRRQRVEAVAWEAEQTGAVVSVAMANSNKNLVSVSEEGIVRIWEVESGSIVKVFGNERGGTVSDLLVFSVFDSCRKKDKATTCNELGSQGFGEREIYKKVADVEGLEEFLGVVVKDRRRAIDMLEVAIETYERLLGLLLKEAKGGEGKEEQSKKGNFSVQCSEHA